jgi:hypothetical protein
VLRGISDEHSAKCHMPVCGLAGVFESAEAAQRETAWLALYSGCTHLRLLKVPLNRISGKAEETLNLRELRACGEAAFEAVFVQDGPEKSQLVSAPLLLSELEAWCSSTAPQDPETTGQRVAQIKLAISAGQWERWSRGAYDALLQPLNKVKTQ